MPTLNWMGKDKIVNYDSTVPYHVLNHSYNFGGESENKIIHGDNLLALKSLLPVYEGRVKCIYIDPPYNTGNEGWIYNDNVNSPKIQKWLGQVVGREGEDFSRHDKWLCMMYPRLKLLKQLLSDDGAIFISIDDNEQANLKLICDEIFGHQNFINNIVWQKKYAPANDAKYLSDTHDFIVVYAKRKEIWRPNLFARSEKQLKDYKNPDNDPRGLWRASDLSARTYSANCDYEIIGPTGKIFKPPPTRAWSVTKESFQNLLNENKIWWGVNKDSRPMRKKFLFEVRDGITPETWWTREFADDNKIAKYESKEIFGEKSFMTPKPTRLLERILQLATDKNSIVLDSFAGSGTTAHAVLKLNREDGGQRKFILVEMENYAESITAERVKRVIDGYGKVEGTGGNFDFYEIGEQLFIGDEINENIPLEKIREYVWTIDTRTKYIKPADDCEEFLGIDEGTAYYYYEGILDHEFLAKIRTRADSYIIYAESCALDADFMMKYKIEFRKIPRDILKIWTDERI